MASEPSPRLRVRLGDVVTGAIELRANTVRFTPEPSYVAMHPRPVLGQVFEDDPDRIRSTHHRLSPWFSNLLPERGGPLREIVARQLGIHADREFFMIATLGHDLPGAVTVEAVDDLAVPDPSPAEAPARGSLESVPLKFSLAGVQLKLSMLRAHHGLTFPAGGEGGNWIVKLPFHSLDHVPQNEFSMMTWLKESGIDVPRIELLPADQIHGVPRDLFEPGTRVYAIERFDRSPAGRHHIEDFAQIFDVYPEQKYQRANYESVGRVLLNISGEATVREFVRRLVAVVLVGNGDAHLKNWSVRYLDPLRAELAPAYDYVSTVVYRQFRNDTLALNLDRSKDFSGVTAASFRSFGERIGYPKPEELEALAASFAQHMRTTWFELASHLPLPAEMTEMISSRVEALPLVRQAA